MKNFDGSIHIINLDGGQFGCGLCQFVTPHEGRIYNHLEKSHLVARPPGVPLELATPKMRKLAAARRRQTAAAGPPETAVEVAAGEGDGKKTSRKSGKN